MVGNNGAVRVKAPLRAIKYSFAIRHRALGPIVQQTTKKSAPENNNNMAKRACRNRRNGFNYLWPHTRQRQFIYWWALAEHRAIYKSLNTSTTSITNIIAVQFAHDKWSKWQFNGGRSLPAHLAALCSANNKLMATQALMRITMTSPDRPHGSIRWVNSKLSIKTPSMNPTRPIQTAIRS